MQSRAATLTELCGVLRNWFDRQRWFGQFSIQGGVLSGMDGKLLPGQYYRILGSTFHDGVWQFPPAAEATPEAGDAQSPVLPDETFEGAVWSMAVPGEVLNLADSIAAWREQYEAAALSPYTQESVPGLYSYIKGASNGSGGSPITWKTVFADRLNRWRKL